MNEKQTKSTSIWQLTWKEKRRLNAQLKVNADGTRKRNSTYNPEGVKSKNNKIRKNSRLTQLQELREARAEAACRHAQYE